MNIACNKKVTKYQAHHVKSFNHPQSPDGDINVSNCDTFQQFHSFSRNHRLCKGKKTHASGWLTPRKHNENQLMSEVCRQQSPSPSFRFKYRKKKYKYVCLEVQPTFLAQVYPWFLHRPHFPFIIDVSPERRSAYFPSELFGLYPFRCKTDFR